MKINQFLFLLIFFGAHVVFVFLYLNKQERLIALSYDLQKGEGLLEALKKKKEVISLCLQESQAQTSIKKYSQAQSMRPMKLNDIRKLVDE